MDREWTWGIRAVAARGLLAAGLLAAATLAPDAAAPVHAATVENGFADLVQKVAPAVVYISTTQTVERSGDGAPPHFQGPPGSPFDEFFKRFMQPPGDDEDMHPGPGGKVTALGSGFVIDPAGYVVTNNHVVGKADSITVQIGDDQKKLPAKLIGRDEKTDLALLKVDAPKPLPFVEFGDSDRARVGDWVLAVGNPFGLGGTVTAGIISARGRDINQGPFDDFLQIDAPINRGNSGGPTFNTEGRVIGINTAIYSPSGGSVGIGFAIPANLARPVIDALRHDGKIERGWLGVSIQPVTQEVADGVGLTKPAGALVAKVEPDSPAAKAGLKQSDVILSIDDKDIADIRDLTRRVAEIKPGTGIKIGVWRGNGRTQLDATVGAPREVQVASAAEPPKATEDKVIGLTLTDLTPAVRQRLGLGDEVAGVAVTAVAPDSDAANKGIRPGDVIVSVGQKPVTKPSDVADRVREATDAGRTAVLLLIHRGDGDQFVAVKPDKA